MGRPLRHECPDTIFFITNRVIRRQFRLRPCPRINAIIRGCLTWAASKHGVLIYCFKFMSNHFHLMARAPHRNLSAFMGDFQVEVTRRVNTLHGRKGPMWAHRFHAEPILDEAALVDKMRYILCNGVEAGLVAEPGDWPGLTSWHAQVSGEEAIEGRFILSKELRPLQREDPELTRDDARITYRLELTRLPCWDDLDQATYRRKLEELVEGTCKKTAKRLEALGRDFLGAKKVLRQSWKTCARSPDTRRRPLCHASCRQVRQDWREEYDERRDRYIKAAAALRKGQTRAPPEFPEGTYPPGRQRCVGAPRHAAFAAAA
jgi:REP element-mobilizing transposase RayT